MKLSNTHAGISPVLLVVLAAVLVLLAAPWASVRERLADAQVLSAQYPPSDCGRNDYHVLRVDRGPESEECIPLRIWSLECIKYWLVRYELRDSAADAAAADAAARGLPFGAANRLDEVYRDLMRGVITCP